MTNSSTYEDRHGGEHSGAHGSERDLVGGPVGRDGVELGAAEVDSSEDEVGTDVALVPGSRRDYLTTHT